MLLPQIYYNNNLSAVLHAIPQHTAANSFGYKSGNGARKPTSLTSCSTKELQSLTKRKDLKIQLLNVELVKKIITTGTFG